ncbi:hypothetical protein MFLAVUS_006243 [Mucor flavus]|uniref:Kinesin motor domain-containing protein n=1 Tax=Mucor flavus TaxID=439312 RepID=A0ABP9Z111_9FUNG
MVSQQGGRRAQIIAEIEEIIKPVSLAMTTLRIRPLTERDRAQPRFANLAHDDVLKIHDSTVQVVPQNKLFTFDHVFGINSTQEEIFSALGENLIRKFVEGYNITILAYGQTSSGKTYTMGTAADGQHNTSDEGIVPRSMALLFDLLNNNDTRPISPTSSLSSSTSASNKSNSRLRPKSKIGHRTSHIPQVPPINKTKFTVKVSFIEIYNEDLHDLLNSAPPEELPPITIREDTKGRIYWTGVKEVLVHSTDDVLYYLEQGTQNRATGSTDMNAKSSRSHAIFSVSLTQEKWIPSNVEKKRPSSSMSTRSSITPNTSRLFAASQEDGECLITTSKFHFVDLAGSERLKRTAAEGDRRKEGININAGLLALGNVISALGDPSKKTKVHVPYRDSKLTRLLQDSLGGSATTLMIACASPVEYNLSETLNTLQYANRARSIKNRSEKNQVEEWMTTENIELLRSLIGKLKNELNYLKSNRSPSSLDKEDEDETYHDQRMLISDLQRQVEELDVEASVTRERNRMVEKELERVRRLEAMVNNKNDMDFQHLVEPVIEEYEKSVSTLESQLALARAALNHSDIGHEEQQTKLTQLENLIRSQEQTINGLQLRLGKVLEREQSNEGYIYELETKLMKSANETTKDQEMLNELKNRIMKFKETDENTEQYIHSLEQRLAAGDAERVRLTKSVEDLEAKIEAKERTNVELLKRLSKTTTDNDTEKLMLKELDLANAKNLDLETQRTLLQQRIDTLEKENSKLTATKNESNGRIENTPDAISKTKSLTTTSTSPTTYKNRKSFASETETPASAAALALIKAETLAKEETERANRLQLELEQLQFYHQDTSKELEEVLQRYHECLEQLDFLERDSSSITAHEDETIHAPKSLDLSKEIAQAKEDAYEQEKVAFESKIADLQQALSKQDEHHMQVQKLEHDLGMANKQIYMLKQTETDEKTALQTEAEKAVDQEKQQTKQWKTAHGALKQDVEKLALDLDQKETYIVQLKQKAENSASLESELKTLLDESNQQSTSLQKRLAETLATLTVLKLSHEGLLKKQVDADAVAKYKEEAESHQSKLADMQQRLDAMDQTLNSATSDKEMAVQKVMALETQLKEQTERLVLDHASHVSALSLEFEKESNNSKEKMTLLETEIELAKNIHQENLIIHNQRLREANAQHDDVAQALKDQIQHLQTHSEGQLRSIESQHGQKAADLEAELNELNDHLIELTKQHEMDLDTINRENESLTQSLDELCDVHAQHEESALQLNALKLELNDLKSSHAKQLEQLYSQHDDEAMQGGNAHAKQLEQLNAQHESALETIKLEKEQLDSLQQQSSLDHKKAAEALQLELTQHQALHDEHVSVIEQLKLENQSLTSVQQSMRQLDEQQHTDTTQQVNALQQELSRVHSDYADQIQDLNTQHQTDVSGLTCAHQKLVTAKDQERHTEYAAAETALAQLQKEHTGLTKKMVSLEAELVSAKADHVTLAQKLDDALTQHEQKIASLTSAHHDQVETIERQHADKLAKYEQDGKAQDQGAAAAVKELTQDLGLLRTSQLANEETIQQQRQTIEGHLTKINQLSQEIKDTDEKGKLYQQRISRLEEESKQMSEDNKEYTSLAEELEAEMKRMTGEMEVIAEDLDESEESVHVYQEQINEMKSVLGVVSDDAVLPKIKVLLEERSASSSSGMSIVDSSETQGDQSSANNNDISNKNGSGAMPQQQGPLFNAATEEIQQKNKLLLQELQNCQNQLKDMVSRDELESLQQQLHDEKQKLDRSDKTIKKLEKQLDELLRKKSSFMCF